MKSGQEHGVGAMSEEEAGATNMNKLVQGKSFTAIVCQGGCQIKEEQGEKEYGTDTSVSSWYRNALREQGSTCQLSEL